MGVQRLRSGVAAAVAALAVCAWLVSASAAAAGNHEFSFKNLSVSFDRPAGLYGESTGTTSESFSGTACGATPLNALWTIMVTNSYKPEGTVEPRSTVTANFHKTNPFSVDYKTLVTNGGATVLATATTTLTLTPTPSIRVGIKLTGKFTPGASSGFTRPIVVTPLPPGQPCP